jgi:hypothetical protein
MFDPAVTVTKPPVALSKTVLVSLHLHLIAHKSSILVMPKSRPPAHDDWRKTIVPPPPSPPKMGHSGAWWDIKSVKNGGEDARRELPCPELVEWVEGPNSPDPSRLKLRKALKSAQKRSIHPRAATVSIRKARVTVTMTPLAFPKTTTLLPHLHSIPHKFSRLWPGHPPERATGRAAGTSKATP